MSGEGETLTREILFLLAHDVDMLGRSRSSHEADDSSDGQDEVDQEQVNLFHRGSPWLDISPRQNMEKFDVRD